MPAHCRANDGNKEALEQVARCTEGAGVLNCRRQDSDSGGGESDGAVKAHVKHGVLVGIGKVETKHGWSRSVQVYVARVKVCECDMRFDNELVLGRGK